ncbi:Monooxygenase, FAD-binding [Sphingomonas paucimobilis]|nr:Monooxygenase, FAD-binding [Sphingomonas paucimobilis]
MTGKQDPVLIVGGGIAGMACAISAARNGVDVEVIDKYGPMATVGIGITHAANVLRVLRDLDVLDECIATGGPFDGWVFTDANGENRRRVDMPRLAGDDKPAMMGMTRPDFARVLTSGARREGARTRFEITVQSFEQDKSGVDVTFSDGSRQRYRAIVGADGVHSQIRPMLFGDLGAPRHIGQAAWRVFMPRLPEINDLWLCDSGQGGKAGFVPLRSDLMYLYLTDTYSEPRPPEGDFAEILFERLKVFGGPVGECRDRYVRDGREILWRMFEFVDLPPPWHRGRAIIIGDAAHAASAHLGQGGAMAIEDGYVLGEELGRHDSVEQAFAAFMERRFERASSIQRWSQQICEWERDKSPDADAPGLTAKAFQLVQQPI